VNGYWMRKDNSGLSVVLFVSEDAAKQAVNEFRTISPRGSCSGFAEEAHTGFEPAC